MHYLHKLENVKDNCAKTWKLLNQIISRNTMKKSIDEIIDNNSITLDHKRIADSFNAFFANVGKNLAAKIPASNLNFKEYLNTNISDSILIFKPTDDKEIQQIINSLKNSHSKGHDDFSVNTIKTVAIIYRNLSV